MAGKRESESEREKERDREREREDEDLRRDVRSVLRWTVMRCVPAAAGCCRLLPAAVGCCRLLLFSAHWAHRSFVRSVVRVFVRSCGS